MNIRKDTPMGRDRLKIEKGHLTALGQWRTIGKVTTENGIKST